MKNALRQLALALFGLALIPGTIAFLYYLGTRALGFLTSVRSELATAVVAAAATVLVSVLTIIELLSEVVD